MMGVVEAQPRCALLRQQLHGNVLKRKEAVMGTYSLDELMQRWYTEDLTTEQVIGQILQVLQELRKRVDELESRSRPQGVITPRRKS
jgi:hypothetical protein